MPVPPAGSDDDALPRPLPATYWVVPGRLLVGEHPVGTSSLDTVERLSRVLSAPGALVRWRGPVASMKIVRPTGTRTRVLVAGMRRDFGGSG